jgi:WD40 repeat protein
MFAFYDIASVDSLAFRPDGRYLSAGATGAMVGRYAPDGSFTQTIIEDPIRIWDARTGEVARKLFTRAGDVVSLAWSPDGTRLASASFNRDVLIWRPFADTRPEVVESFSSGAWSVAFDPSGTRLAAAVGESVVILDVRQ